MNDLDTEIARQALNGEHQTAAILAEQDKDEEGLDNTLRTLRGSGFVFHLWRKRVYDPDFNFMTKILADDFDIEMIKQSYGGGRYRAKVTDSTGKYRKNFTFGIDESFKGRNETESGDKGVDSIALAQTVAGIAKREDNTGLIVAMMEKQTQSQQQQMERQQTQSQQFLTMMLQIQSENTKAMMGMMTAMASSNKGNDNFSSSITPILIKMIDNSASKSANADMDIDRLIKLKEFLTPPEVEKPGLLDKVLDAAPAMIPLFLGNRMPQMLPGMPDPSSPAGTPPTAALPRPVETASASCAPPVGEAPSDKSKSEAKPKVELVPLLKRGAELDSDPASYAVIVLDIVGREQEEQITAFLRSEEWKKLFLGFNEKEMAWVEEWRKELIEMTTESDEDEGEEDPEPSTEPKNVK